MNISRITYLIFIFILLRLNVTAQDDCVIKLNEAEKLYESGNIEQIPDLLSNCINYGFNRENKIQALKLLTLVYLSDDNTVKAEKSLLELLKVDPEFKTNQAIDPVEFIKLYNSFNTSPVFSVGLYISPGATFPFLLETFSQVDYDDANTNYKASNLSISAGIKTSYHINHFWDISFEPSFSYMSFQVSEKVLPTAIATLTETMSCINLPIATSHYFYKLSIFDFYGEVGFSYNMFLSGKISGDVSYPEREQSPNEPPEVDTKGIRPEYNICGNIGAGARIKLNRSNLQIGIRYHQGLLNQGNPDLDNEFTDNLYQTYKFRDNEFLLNKLSFAISYNREFYIHRKKPNNQTNYDVLK